MSVEFEELAKLRENPSDETGSKYHLIFHIFLKIITAFSHTNYSICGNFSDMVDFTDEEGYGKYLDLHECYEKYINLKGIEVSFCMSQMKKSLMMFLNGAKNVVYALS
jgi:splicing factor 3A subunit 3